MMHMDTLYAFLMQMPSNPMQREFTQNSVRFDLFGMFMLFFAIGFLLLLLVHVVIAIWAVNDAKNRGMDSPALWVFIILIFPIIGPIIYAAVRPSGVIDYCSHCQNRRMESLKRCPHCGHE